MSSTVKITKPSDDLVWLVEHSPIRGISIDRDSINLSSDEPEDLNYVNARVTGYKGLPKVMSLTTVQTILDISLDVDSLSVARVKRIYFDQVGRWKEFERENAHDLAEYNRLKTKLGL